MTITINQKQSGTGSIYDLASDQYDRTINMGGYKYAIVAPAYYNLSATRHKTMDDAIRAAGKLSDYSGVVVLDAAGDLYDIERDELRPLGRNVND